MYNDLNLFGKNDPLRDAASSRMKLTLDDKFYDVYSHGNPETLSGMSPDQLANFIKSDGNYTDGMTVKLWACRTGCVTDSYAQKLADTLSTTVIAPDKLVWYKGANEPYVSGRLINSVTVRKFIGKDPPNMLDKGKFNTFNPN